MTKKIEQTIELTEAEWAIMKSVWENEPCAAGTVQESLQNERDWAYSTVKTTMDRMAKKGLLKITKIRNLQLFSSCVTETQAKCGEFHKMLTRAFGGSIAPMMQFLINSKELSPEEIVELREIIKDKK